jgi:hypothetical protein
MKTVTVRLSLKQKPLGANAGNWREANCAEGGRMTGSLHSKKERQAHRRNAHRRRQFHNAHATSCSMELAASRFRLSMRHGHIFLRRFVHLLLRASGKLRAQNKTRAPHTMSQVGTDALIDRARVCRA